MKKDYEVKIDEAVRELHFVGDDNIIEIYADRGDTGEFLQETVYENRDSKELESLIRDEIYDGYFETICKYEDEILEKACVVGEDFEQDALEYLRDNYSIEPDYEHFLSHEIKVNIMLRTDNERDNEYTTIYDQYLAMTTPDELTRPEESLKEDSMLVQLLKQQGHTLDELQSTMKDYNKFFYDDTHPSGNHVERVDENGEELSLSGKLELFNKTHNAFLTSVCQELENQCYQMGVMTVLAKMSIKDFIEMQQGDKQIIMPKECMIGIYNPWNGAGSVLDIELEKDLVFSTDMIRDVQIEGVKPQWEYTVDDVYGLIGSCWKEPKSIEDSKPFELKETGHDYDFSATVHNKTDSVLKFKFEEDLGIDGFEIAPNDWVGLLADEDGRKTYRAIENEEYELDVVEVKPQLDEVIKSCEELSKSSAKLGAQHDMVKDGR